MPTQVLSNKNTLGYLGEREKESLRKEGMALTSLAYLQKKKKKKMFMLYLLKNLSP